MAITYSPIEVLFELGSLQAKSYGLMLALAFLVAIIYLLREAKKRKIDESHVYKLVILAIISAIIGSRLLYVLVNLNYFILNPVKMFAIGEGGLYFYGGLILGILVFVIYLKINKLNILKFLDIFSPSVVLGLSIARIGCFLGWHCYGIQSSLPWAVIVGNDVARHPTQIYSVIANFLIFLFLYQTNKKRKKLNGVTTGLFLVLYGGFRFLIEFIKYDEARLGIFTVSHIVSAVLIIVGFIILKKKYTK